MKEIENWFKLKRYPHIGLPITIKDYLWVKKYVTNTSSIKKHSFLPLIRKCITQRKFRAVNSQSERTPTGKRKRIKTTKERDIFYASHLDSLIFSYYNSLLVEAYEKHIKFKKYKNSVVAYRKIPLCEESNKHKCNIDFAKTVFQYIAANDDKKLTVIVADVTKFFDNLSHKILKKQWCRVLGQLSLPDDHYNVYKALTRIKYVEGSQLFKSYSKTMLVERGVPNSSKKTEYKRKGIKERQYFKEKDAIAYCEKDDFVKNNLNLVISKNNCVGIPQGSAISATLANIYMLDFDQKVFDEVNSIGGFYQRYSDDLIIVCEQQYENEIIKTVRQCIENLAKLEIQAKKTKVYHFEEVMGKFLGFEIDENSKIPNYNKTLEYLGFSFNGQRVLVKSAGFSKYYRSVIRSFKKSASLAKNSKNPDRRIFRSSLYKRFTHRGAKRRLIYHPSKTDKTKYERTKEFNWGNYLSYINKANDTMKVLNKSDCIKKQSRRFWRFFHLQMEKYNVYEID
jgi:hypothetical protein